MLIFRIEKRNLKRSKQIIGKNFEAKKIYVILVNQLNGLILFLAEKYSEQIGQQKKTTNIWKIILSD